MPFTPARDDHPLAGVTVADFSRVLSGPFCTRMLTDLGAEVIKIEPPNGDLSRFLGNRRRSMSGYYMQQNTGKENVSIDLKSDAGRTLAKRLALACDIVVENFRPGVMKTLGLDAETLRAEKPGLIYCSISGFGQEGPWRERRAFAGVAHASTGTTFRQLQISGSPAFDSVLAVGDTVTGLQSVVAILAALRVRERTGEGQTIDMAMHDSLLSIQECANFYLFEGEKNSDPNGFLCSWVYPCQGEIVALPPDPRSTWDDLTKIIGQPELATDERYDTLAKREAVLDELEAHIALWISEQPSAQSVVDQFEAAGYPAARIVSMQEALDGDQTASRDMTPEIDDRTGRRTRILNSPYRFSGAASGVRGLPAFRGEDNRGVLGRVLGLSDAEIDALEASGAVSSRIPDHAAGEPD